MTAPRSDSPLIRHLAKSHSEAVARAWQVPPLVLLPGEGFVGYLLNHEQELMGIMSTLEHLPWSEVVFDYQGGRRVITAIAAAATCEPPLPDRGGCWIRLCTLPRYRSRVKSASPWLAGPEDLLAPFDIDPDDWLVIEAWEEKIIGTGGFPGWPDVSLVSRSLPWSFGDTAHLYPNQFCRDGRAYGSGHGFCNLTRCKFPGGMHADAFPCHGSELVMSSGVRLVLLTLAYLLQTDEYLVEVSPANPPDPAREQRTAKVKPWLRSLPHIILLDPTRTRSRGEPEVGGDGTQTKRVSPRPHGRRGHWATLRAARFARNPDGSPRRVFVRPAWIGEREWEADGQRYRVLDPIPVTP